MRLLLVALLMIGGLLLAGSLASSHASSHTVVMRLSGISFVLAIGVLVLINHRQRKLNDPGQFEDNLRELEAKGLLVKTDFKASRVFEVEDSGDEGSHLFFELEDGGVLYLNGEAFAYTEFTVIRHKENGLLMDIQHRGTELKPEVTCPAFSKARLKNGQVWSDGDVIRDRSYDPLKAELMKG